MAGGLAFRWSLRRRNDNLPVPLCPYGKSVDSADLSAMVTVFPGVCSERRKTSLTAFILIAKVLSGIYSNSSFLIS